MNSKNKYFARNPNHPIPEMSASEYLGVPYDAEFEAWYENDFKNNGYTMPFLRYMGPGNSTNRGEPVNYADYLSKLHDLRYAYASFLAKNKRITKEQYEDRVNYADHEFVKDQSSWDPQGIIAKAGIGGKMMFEKVIELFGGESHQYPGNPENEDFSTPLDEEVDIIPMAPPKHPFGYTAQGVPKSSSQWQHGIHTAAGNKYGRRGARDPEKFKEYIKLRHQELQKELGERYWQVFKPDAKQYNLHHENRENQSAASIEEAQSNKRPAEENIDEASTSKQTKEGEPSTSTVTEPEPSTSTETTSDTNTTTEKPQETPQESEQMRSKQVSEPMQVDTPANSTMSTGSNVSGGTGIAVAAQQIYSSRGFRQEGNRITYNNHFRTRVYGNALYTAAGATTATTIDPSTCTYPLAALPVEMLAFYIPEGLFNALKDLPNCKPTRIAVKVTPIGVMCSFSTNSSATQSGTTSHTLYGAAVVGLNKKIPVDKVTITRDTSFPMVVSAVAKWSSMDEWIKRIWGQLIPSGTAPIANDVLKAIVSSGISGEIIIPNTYLRVFFPTPPLATTGQQTTDASTVNSYWNIGRLIPKQPLQPHVGTPMAQMEYSYDWPCLSSTVTRLVTYGPKASGITVTRRGKRGAQKLVRTTLNDGTACNTNQTDEISSPTYARYTNSSVYAAYSLNNVPSFDSMTFEQNTVGSAVPSIHFGPEAVKANVPEATTEDYVNASCDYLIETEIEFDFNMQHEFNFEKFNVICDNYKSGYPIGLVNNTTALQSNVIYRRGLPLIS